MNFYISNPLLDNQIADIKQKIKLHMNGVTSEQMKEHGIVYKKNFGVSIPHLREIARNYEPNHDLAQRLWFLSFRESMILATLLQPADKFTKEIAMEWQKDVTNIELVEQICMNLLCKLPYAYNLAYELITSYNIWEQICGFILTARIYQHLSDDNIKDIIRIGMERSQTENLHLYKAIALSYSRLSRKSPGIADYVLDKINSMSSNLTKGQEYIKHEVKEEISFLKNL